MNSICQKLILLLLIMASALMSAPGLNRSIAKAQLHDSEAPSQTVEKFEIAQAGITRQNRRLRFDGHSQLGVIRPRVEHHLISSLRTIFGASPAVLFPDWPGHRLPNGLLAPIRI